MSKDVCINDGAKKQVLRFLMNEDVSQKTIDKIIDMPKCKIKKDKKPRKPSGYNIFMGGCAKSADRDIPAKERFAKCAAEWRELSDSEKRRYKA